MGNTWIASCPKGKDISSGNAPGLQNQVSGEDMTRQIAIEIQNSGAAGRDPPEDSDEQDVLDPRQKEAKQFHQDLGHPSPQKELGT